MQFFKYHGTGNDFIMVDNRENAWQPTTEEVAELCDRHFGIGADGLILIEGDEETEFYMNYYNSDGSQSF
jgi:diaminopimelate epimerase